MLAAPCSSSLRTAEPSSERIARAFIAAAGNAGADAVELDADRYDADLVSVARRNSLHPVARVALADDVRFATSAGVGTFHVSFASLQNSTLTRALADAATCIIVSGAPVRDADLARLADAGAQVILLFSHDALTKHYQVSSAVTRTCDNILSGCDLAESAAPLTAGGVLVAAFGVSLVRQCLAVEGGAGQGQADRFLSQEDFRTMVQDIRTAERILGRRHAAAPPRSGHSLAAGRTLRRGGLISREHFQPAAGMKGRIAKIAVGNGHAVFASELAATITVAVDFTDAPKMHPEAVELLLSRIGRARTVDHTCAITTGREVEDVRRALVRCKTNIHRLEESWLAGLLSLAAESRADVVVWVPAQNVLTDPELLDRMVIQHVRSGADYTLCSDLPRGLSPRLVSVGALRRISAFTGGADTATVHKLLSNHKIFRVQETIVESSQCRPDLDLTWHSNKKALFDRIVQTGSESASELIARTSHLQDTTRRPSESEACEPFCSYSFLTTGGGLSATM